MDAQLGITRRRFIATTTAAAAGFTIVPRHVLGGPGFIAPSDRVNVALIGAGGQGRTNARALFEEPNCQIIALADPADEWDLSGWYFGGKSGRGPVHAEVEAHYGGKTPNHRCAVYEDFRVMLEKEKAIDAVLISTPDHLHAYASILAMKSGKHVYCEKPLTHNVNEARHVARIARETGVATQMGNQGRSSEGHRQTIEWLRDGAIGAVREVHAWSGKARSAGSQPPRQGPARKPSRLNWDLWLGPRADRAFSGSYAPFVWRWWWDFGGGTLADMGAHNFDPAFNALALDTPLTIEARGSEIDPERSVGSHMIIYQFGARADRGPITAYWYDNGLQAPTPRGVDPDDARQRLGEDGNGLLIIGDKGSLTCPGWSGMPRLLPYELHRAYQHPAKTLPRVAGHYADWLQACMGGTPACSNFEYGARLTEFLLLGNIALRSGKVLKWDAAAARATNVPEAQAFIEGSYRKGWELPV